MSQTEAFLASLQGRKMKRTFLWTILARRNREEAGIMLDVVASDQVRAFSAAKQLFEETFGHLKDVDFTKIAYELATHKPVYYASSEHL